MVRAKLSEVPVGRVVEVHPLELTTTLSRRSCPVAPSVPVEVPWRRQAKPGVLPRMAGRVRVKAYQVAGAGRVTVRPLAVKAPVAPVVEYASWRVSGPVADR